MSSIGDGEMPRSGADHTFEVEAVDAVAARGELRRLAAGLNAAVIWRNVLGPEFGRRVVAVGSDDFEAYDLRRLDPPILKIGPAVYDYYVRDRLDDGYFRDAQKASDLLERIFGCDPISPLLDRLSEETGARVSPASIGGRPLHVGILREFPTGSKIHYDEVVREFPGHLDVEPIVQLAFNAYLTMPEDGGTLIIWKHRWIPADDKAADGYGWSREILTDEPSVVVRPKIGDGIFFDCRNFHQVADFTVGRRITLSFFCGFTIGGEVIVWS